jgi:hypothetical protein
MSFSECDLCGDCGRELDPKREDLENTYCAKCDPDAPECCEFCDSPLEAEQVSENYCSACSQYEPTCAAIIGQAKACKHLSSNHYQTESRVKFDLTSSDTEFELKFSLGKIVKTYSWTMGQKPRIAVLTTELYESEQEIEHWQLSALDMFSNAFGNSVKPLRSRSDPKKTPYCK